MPLVAAPLAAVPLVTVLLVSYHARNSYHSLSYHTLSYLALSYHSLASRARRPARHAAGTNMHLDSRCVLLSDPSTFGARGSNGPYQNTSRTQHAEV